MTPLRFSNPSPSSGWIEDLHLQAVVHTRHTAGSPGQAGRRHRLQFGMLGSNAGLSWSSLRGAKRRLGVAAVTKFLYAPLRKAGTNRLMIDETSLAIPTD